MSPSPRDFPRSSRFEEDERGALLLLGAVRGARFGNRAPADERHLRLLGELRALERPFDGREHRDALLADLDRAPDAPFATFLRNAIETTAPGWQAVRSLHFAHGDFTPWNCLDCGARLGVVDWEMAGYRLPGWDVLRYLVQIEAITRSGPEERAADRILRDPLLARAEPVVAGDAGPAWRELQALVLIAGAVELLATQPELSRRGIAVRSHAVARLLGVPARA